MLRHITSHDAPYWPTSGPQIWRLTSIVCISQGDPGLENMQALHRSHPQRTRFRLWGCCVTAGTTLEQAKDLMQEAIIGHIALLKLKGKRKKKNHEIVELLLLHHR